MREGATSEQLHAIIAWQHFYRAVTTINPKKAVENVALLHALLHDLRSPSAPDVTVYMGHDGNLDGLAALLNLSWAATPYIGGSDLSPTPPGSALHFLLEATGELKLRFLYPVYTAVGSHSAAMLNRSGILEAQPVENWPPSHASLDNLEARVEGGLNAYADAGRCYRQLFGEP